MPNRRLLKFLAVLARYEVKDFVFTSLDAQLLACSARVSLKSDRLLERLGVGRKKSKATGERLAGPPAVLRYRGVVIEPLRPSAMPGKPARPAAGSASTPFRLAGGSVHLSSRIFEPLDPRVE